MASDKQAQLLANLVRERFVLARVAEIAGLPDYDDEYDAALGLDREEASDQITQLRGEIRALRDRYPITRWVDADPHWRDESGRRENWH